MAKPTIFPHSGAKGALRDSQRLAVPRATLEILCHELAYDDISPAGVEFRARCRDHIQTLLRLYPELRLTESDLAQQLAEEDGDAQDDAP